MSRFCYTHILLSPKDIKTRIKILKEMKTQLKYYIGIILYIVYYKFNIMEHLGIILLY